MIQVKFKNLEKSDLVRTVVTERLQALVDKFEDLEKSTLKVILEMQNSPTQPGPDVFVVKLLISGGRFKGTFIQKSSANLYSALADLIDHMLEKLNRAGDKKRVVGRSQARKLHRERLDVSFDTKEQYFWPIKKID